MSLEFKDLLRQGRHLNVLASIIIVSLLVMVGILVFALVVEVEIGDLWLLRNDFVRILVPGLLLMVILYMADSHARLRKSLQQAYNALTHARNDLEGAYERVVFAHEVSTIVSDLKRHDVMGQVLRESVAHYDTDAAAIVTGDDIEVYASNEDDEDMARTAAMTLAIETVRAGTPVSHKSTGGGHAIAVPIRVKGILHSVAVLWRRVRDFPEEEIENLKLLARMLELGIENKHLVLDLQHQVKGSLGLLTTLIEDRQQDYAGHSSNVASLAVAVGRKMGIVGDAMEDLKIAGLVHDLGMLRVPNEILAPRRSLTPEERVQLEQHPVAGSQLARAAGLRLAVQEAVLSHHEAVDGSGYPSRLKGLQIPLLARIIAVCDTYDAMTRQRSNRKILSPREALKEISRLAGVKYDAGVAEAFSAIMEEQLGLVAFSGLADVAAGTEGLPRPVSRSV